MMKQWRELTKNNHDPEVDRCKQHIQDLIAQVKQDHHNNSLTLIIGDFNENLKDPQSNGLKQLISDCNLVNSYTTMLGFTPSSRQNHR